MTKIRVIRILEYTYENAELASDDMSRWTRSIRTKHLTMKSAELPMEAIEWESE